MLDDAVHVGRQRGTPITVGRVEATGARGDVEQLGTDRLVHVAVQVERDQAELDRGDGRCGRGVEAPGDRHAVGRQRAGVSGVGGVGGLAGVEGANTEPAARSAWIVGAVRGAVKGVIVVSVMAVSSVSCRPRSWKRIVLCVSHREGGQGIRA